MRIERNPTANTIGELAELSVHKAAKCIWDARTGDVYYWPADHTQHAEVAALLNITTFTKGIAVSDAKHDKR